MTREDTFADKLCKGLNSQQTELILLLLQSDSVYRRRRYIFLN